MIIPVDKKKLAKYFVITSNLKIEVIFTKDGLVVHYVSYFRGVTYTEWWFDSYDINTDCLTIEEIEEQVMCHGGKNYNKP